MNNTNITLKRTNNNYDNFKEGQYNSDETLNFGEPLFIDNGINGQRCNAYIAMGIKPTGTDTIKEPVKNARVFKAFKDKETADKIVFNNDGSLTDEDGNDVSVNQLTTYAIEELGGDTKYYILAQASNDSGHVRRFEIGNNGIYITGNGVMHGAAWNDYAEYRKARFEYTPGTVVIEDGLGGVIESNSKLDKCPYVVSDTYGMVVGEEKDSVPVAVSGRVLVNVDCDVEVGDCLCAGPEGKATKMSRLELINYPDRLLGIVVEIPSYEKWNKIEVNKRVWIRIK